MTVRTIAFSVQLGTEGLAIAQTVAGRLGFHYLDWNDTARAASEAGLSPQAVNEFEHNRPRLLRIVDKLLGSASMISDEVTSDANVDADVMSWAMRSLGDSGYREFVENVVRELAVHGESVIVGHAAQVVLRDEPGAYRILVYGEEAHRAQRLATETGDSLENALRSIRKSDQERLELYKRVYDVDPFAPELYDLTVNTDRAPKEVAIESIVAAARELSKAPAQA